MWQIGYSSRHIYTCAQSTISYSPIIASNIDRLAPPSLACRTRTNAVSLTGWPQISEVTCLSKPRDCSASEFESRLPICHLRAFLVGPHRLYILYLLVHPDGG